MMNGVTRLKSADGQTFEVSNEALMGVETLNSMLNLTDGELDEEEVTLEKIDSHYLQVIVDWLNLKREPVKLSPDQLFELIVHVNYLKIPDLLEWCCQAVVDKLIMKKDGRYEIDINPACFNDNCSVSSNLNLQNCARCKIGKYCSKYCQEEDWRKHKGDCKAIKTQMKAMKEETKALENFFRGRRYENLFQTQCGEFWEIRETRDFCRAKYRLAHAFVIVGDKKRQKHIYDAAIDQYLSLLRLVQGDNMSVRDQLPFVFLKANRDQDCYDFVKSRILRVRHPESDVVPKSKEGDWLYLRGENMLEDPAPYLMDARPAHYLTGPLMLGRLELSLQVTLLCIKSRIISKCESILHARSEILSAAASSKLQPLNDVLPKLYDLLREQSPTEIRALEKTISTQLTQSHKLMCIIKNRSKTFFPAVLNPDPLLSQPSPTTLMYDTPEETHFVLKQCLEIIRAIPGALPNISTFIGQEREYDHKFYVPECQRSSDQEGILMWYCTLDPLQNDPEHFKNLIIDKIMKEHYKAQIVEEENGGASVNMDSYY